MKKTNLLLLALASLTVSSFAQNETKTRDLSKYKITGSIAHTFDTNKGFIYDERNPVLNFCFEDEKGNKARANFQCHMKTVGNIINLSCKYYFARFVGASFSLKDAQDRPIDLGMGACVDRPIPKGTGHIKLLGIFPIFFNGQPLIGPTYILEGFGGLGAHISKLKNRDGAFVLAAPTVGVNGGIPLKVLRPINGTGIVLGGNLTMLGSPVFEDALENSKNTAAEATN